MQHNKFPRAEERGIQFITRATSIWLCPGVSRVCNVHRHRRTIAALNSNVLQFDGIEPMM